MKRILEYSGIIAAALFLLSCASSSSSSQSTTSSIVEEYNELFVDAIIPDASNMGATTMVLEFYQDAGFSGTAVKSFDYSVDFTGETGQVEKPFTIIYLAEGGYYLRVFLDDNSNGSLDSGEKYGVYMRGGEISTINISSTDRLSVEVTLDQSS